MLSQCTKILAFNPFKSFYGHLERARLDCLRQCVRVIRDIRNEAEVGYYTQTALAYKSTLERLILRTWDEDARFGEVIPYYTRVYNIIRKQLNSFPDLKLLKFFSYTNQSIFELEPIIDNCQLLKEIEITPLLLQDTVRNQQINGTRRDEGEIRYLSTVKQIPSVKKFTGERMMMTDWFIRYLMHNFTQVDTLMLNTTDDDKNEQKIM